MKRELSVVPPSPVLLSGPFAGVTEAELAQLLTTLCDVGSAPEGPLLWRIGVLTERVAGWRADHGKAKK